MNEQVSVMLHEIARRHRVSLSYLLHRGRGPAASKARAEMAWRLRLQRRSLPEIGRLLGGYHHTSIMHLLRAYPLPDPGPNRSPKQYEVTCPDLSGEWAI